MVQRALLFFGLLILGTLVVAQKYTSRYDNLNIDEILDNNRVLNNYIKCILDQGPCTPDGRELRKDIPDALMTNCAKCSPNQKRIVRKASKFLKENKQAEWQKIVKKYDPQAKYQASFDNFLAEA